MQDSRFAHIATDPKFRRIPKGERKVKIDKRFQSMFSDKQFKVKYTVDKRGRPVNHTSTEDLKRYYDLTSSDESCSEDEAEDKNAETPKDKSQSGSSVVDVKKVTDKNDKKVTDAIKEKLKDLNVDYARGEGVLYSSESSSDESEEEASDADVIDHNWGELDADADDTDEVTHRLAACNMDWDRMRAVDLMVLFNSFITQGGLIKSVVIYPSEFGLQRLKDEEIKGPTELVESKVDDDDNDENEDGAKYHMEKLRKYQLNRLKYYYAIITCDSPSTANKIYTECDGMEYESSSTKIDLRFVPEDMTFDAEPKEICDKLPELTKYQPRFFTTTALQQAKVNLTWDETNPERLEITQKLASGKVDDVTETDLQAYLASSSGEEEGDEEDNKSDFQGEEINPIDKYKNLLNEIESKEREKENRNVEMEVSWGIDLKDKTEKMVKKKLADNENKTPFQQYLDKRKDKRKEKRNKKLETSEIEGDIPSGIDMNDAYFTEEFDKPEFKQKSKVESSDDDEDETKEAELELLLMNEDDDKKHFSFKKIQEDESKSKKRRNKKEKEEIADDFEIKVDDERFSALYTSHHFNIDPTDSRYKKTKGMEKIIGEKLKRRNEDDEQVVVKKSKVNKKNAELNVLIKSIKRKAEAFGNKKSK